MTETIISPERTNPAWWVWESSYESVWAVSDKKFFVVRNGEMRINYTLPDGSVDVIRYTNDLERKGITTDLELLDAEELGVLEFVNNAWFEVWSVAEDEYFSQPLYDALEAKELAEKLSAEFPDGFIMV